MSDLNQIFGEIDELNVKELEKVKIKINECLEKKKTKKVIYKHDCFGSSRHHFCKYKHFAKVLSGIDDSKDNGYAFIGDFLAVQKENQVVDGSYVVEVCDKTINLYQICEDENIFLLEGSYNKFITFIKEAKKITGL